MAEAVPTGGDATDSATIEGRLVGISGRSLPGPIEVWFAYRTVDGVAETVEARTDAEDRFTFDLPGEPLCSASIGAVVDGVVAVDLEPGGARLEPGEVVLVVDDAVPAHLRFGCL